MNEDCPFCLYEKTEANCPGCWEGSNYKPKTMTNADRIRGMTDEEMAEWISCNCVGDGYGNSAEEWLNWLKSPAEKGE